jgi:hypothetical protein
MRKLVARRLRNIGLFLLLATVIVSAEFVWSVRLYRTPFITGWILLILLALLAAYTLRKKVPFLPLGSTSTWLQIHIYAGLVSFLVFALHTGFRIPNGTFERLLAGLYLGVFLSGLAGLFLTRVIPPRLTSRGSEIIFERTPILIKSIRDEVEKSVLDSVADTEATAIQDLYLEHLKPFFERPRNMLWHWLHSPRPSQALLQRIRRQQRFLREDEQAVLQGIAERVRVKNDLDHQFALQALLKIWLFVHIPLTYGLLVFALFHSVVVYAFAGGS